MANDTSPGDKSDGVSRIKVIAVHANIASGKTTLLDMAEQAGYRVFRENITKMTPFLEAMYKDAGCSSDMLQMCVAVEQLLQVGNGNAQRDVNKWRA